MKTWRQVQFQQLLIVLIFLMVFSIIIGVLSSCGNPMATWEIEYANGKKEDIQASVVSYLGNGNISIIGRRNFERMNLEEGEWKQITLRSKKIFINNSTEELKAEIDYILKGE